MMSLYLDDTRTSPTHYTHDFHSVAVPLDVAPRLTDFLRLADSPIRFHWQNAALDTAYAGYGAAAIIQSAHPARFDDIRAQAEEVFHHLTLNAIPEQAEPRFFGGFAFQPSPIDAPWRAFRPAWFAIPRVMLTTTPHGHWLTLTDTGRTPTDLRSEAFALAACLSSLTPAPSTQNRLIGQEYPLSQTVWREMVNDALSRMSGDVLQKVVLSRTCDIRMTSPIDPLAALDRLADRYPETYRFMIAPQSGTAFIGATPEVLVEVEGQRVRTAAIAGSTRRGSTPQQDTALAAELFTNPKERVEHALVAENLHDLLEPLTSELRHPEEPHILTLSNIQHLHTPFEGTLSAKRDVLDVARTLHPTPALGGCPQQVALDTIRAIEPISRGWYASPVGWFDRHGSGIFAVAIRSAVINHDTARLYAGCGIVPQSDPDREWDETRIKFRPMLDALGASAS